MQGGSDELSLRGAEFFLLLLFRIVDEAREEEQLVRQREQRRQGEQNAGRSRATPQPGSLQSRSKKRESKETAKSHRRQWQRLQRGRRATSTFAAATTVQSPTTTAV